MRSSCGWVVRLVAAAARSKLRGLVLEEVFRGRSKPRSECARENGHPRGRTSNFVADRQSPKTESRTTRAKRHPQLLIGIGDRLLAIDDRSRAERFESLLRTAHVFHRDTRAEFEREEVLRAPETTDH